MVSIGTGLHEDGYSQDQVEGWGKLGWILPQQGEPPVLGATLGGAADGADHWAHTLLNHPDDPRIARGGWARPALLPPPGAAQRIDPARRRQPADPDRDAAGVRGAADPGQRGRALRDRRHQRNEAPDGTRGRIVLTLLLMAEGITLLKMDSLLSVHMIIGLVLIPPVLLKIGSTGYRSPTTRTHAIRGEGAAAAGAAPVRSSPGLDHDRIFVTGVLLLALGPVRSAPLPAPGLVHRLGRGLRRPLPLAPPRHAPLAADYRRGDRPGASPARACEGCWSPPRWARVSRSPSPWRARSWAPRRPSGWSGPDRPPQRSPGPPRP